MCKRKYSLYNTVHRYWACFDLNDIYLSLHFLWGEGREILRRNNKFTAAFISLKILNRVDDLFCSVIAG